MKHVAGLFYTLLFLDCSGGLLLNLAHHRWLFAAAAALGVACSGGNAYLWSKK